MSDMKKLKRGRIDSLQALRAIAFLAIFVSHVYTKLGMLGGWGVSVFFVLSGFVMVYSYYDKTLAVSFSESIKFSVKKMKKLYLLHILMMIAASFFIIKSILQTPSMRNAVFYVFTLITDTALIQSWFPRKDIYFSINSVAWYLSVCVFIYAVFPVVLRRIKKLQESSRAILGMAVIFTVQAVIGVLVSNVVLPERYSDNFAKWVTYIFPLYRSGDFIIGCFLGYIFLNEEYELNKRIATAAELITIALIMLTLAARKFMGGIFDNEGLNHSIIYTPTSMALIYLFACKKGLITGLITNKVSIYIGNISAYAFLIHIVVINYLTLFSKHFFGSVKSRVVLFALALGITIILTEVYIRLEKSIKAHKDIVVS